MKKFFSLGLIFVLILLASYGSATKLNRLAKNKRAITNEDVAFQLVYLGSCSKFFSIPSFIITKKTITNCLPISNAAPYIDSSDLNADVLCTDIGPNRAQIDFVEIYDPLVGHDTPVTDFIMIFASNAPYKASSTGVSYLRRPSCEIDQDYCSTTDYIKSCTENVVQISNGFVISKDTVYIIPDGSLYVGCAVADSSCCSYIVPGFCPRTTDDSVFRIKFRPQHHHDENHGNHEGHHNNGHHESHERPHERPAHQKPHFRPNDNHHDDDDDDRREHHHNNNNKKQEHQEQNSKKSEQVPSKNTAPNRGKHPINNQELPKEEKMVPLLPLKVMPQNEEESNDRPMIFNLKQKISTSSSTNTAKQVSRKTSNDNEIKPLIPLRVIEDVQVAKHMEENDEDDKKK